MSQSAVAVLNHMCLQQRLKTFVADVKYVRIGRAADFQILPLTCGMRQGSWLGPLPQCYMLSESTLLLVVSKIYAL